MSEKEIPRRPEGSRFTCLWKGVRPSEEELKLILEDHERWVERLKEHLGVVYGREELEKARAQLPPPHDLSGAALWSADLSGANLRWANLDGAHLWGAKLTGADLRWANLDGANLVGANLDGACLWRANLAGTDLRGADLPNCDVTGVRYHGPWLGIPFIKVRKPQKLKCRGIRADTCYGSPRFKRDVMDQDFLEEMRESTGGKILYWLWRITSNCGHSFIRWALCSLLLAFAFACVFCFGLGPECFDLHRAGGGGFCLEVRGDVAAISPIPDHACAAVSRGLPGDFWTMLYYSVVTFTTLGFGDVVPLTPWAAFWVTVEVVAGYIMLGGLVSILANKMARRAG